MPVNTPCDGYTKFAPKWKRLRDCEHGRDAVLAAGKLYAPDLPGADAAENKAYRERGNFYNAVQRTVFGMVGMLYSKDMVVKFPKRLEKLLEDITLTSVSAEMFAFNVTKETLLIGRYGVLVDMPQKGVRPFMTGYPAESIVSWSTQQFGGDGTLTRVVLKEMHEETDPKDEFVMKCEEQYRVLSLEGGIYTQQLWRKGDKDFEKFGDPIVPLRRGMALPFIPFVFLGPLHVSADLVKPPLEDLADVNLAHWRNSVDHEYGLHLTALPTPWVSGMKASGGKDEPFKIGPSVVWELDTQGSAGMLEFSGAGLKSIADSMEEKKRQMASLGARLMEAEAKVQETATAVSMRHGGDHATLRSLAIAIGQGLSMSLQMIAWWMGTEAKPEEIDVTLELNKDFQNVKATSADIQTALAAVQAGKISYETFWHLILTGGWGRDGVTAEQELKQIQVEEPMNVSTDPEFVREPGSPEPKKKPAPTEEE